MSRFDDLPEALRRFSVDVEIEPADGSDPPRLVVKVAAVTRVANEHRYCEIEMASDQLGAFAYEPLRAASYQLARTGQPKQRPFHLDDALVDRMLAAISAEDRERIAIGLDEVRDGVRAWLDELRAAVPVRTSDEDDKRS